jgi:hypothetical protein
MSFACINGGECSGCMKCRESKNHLFCDWCGKEIFHDERYYDMGDETVCEDCIDDCCKIYYGD